MEKDIFVTRSSMPPFEEYTAMIKPLWDSHKLTNMGEYHVQLEDELREFLDVPYVSLMTNGHMALEIILQALDLQGEIITTPFTFISTTHAIVRNKLTPVFCDINEQDYTIDVTKLESLITEKTSAILPVHVYGNICDVEAIQKIADKYELKVIYDAAHALGVKYKGNGIAQYGDASIFSFHATKVYNTVEGGAVAFKDKSLVRKLYGLKNFGIRDEETIDDSGTNAKMDEFRAAMGLCNLKYVSKEIDERKRVFQQYKKNLINVEGIGLTKSSKMVESNYSYFPIRIFEKYGLNRDRLYDILKEHRIFSRKYFYPATNATQCYLNRYQGETPVARKISESILALPMYGSLSNKEVDYICEVIRKQK